MLGNRCGLVKISTDEGIAGWGECTLENWVRTSTAAVERMAEHLIGRDPSEITRLWQLLARGGYYRGGPVLSSAVAGIDQALWDIKGRALGAGVHELLGGPTRDWIRAYAHANAPGRTGDPGRAREQVAAGMSVIKVSPEFPIDNPAPHALIESIAQDLAALRDALGPAVEIAIDLHGRTSDARPRRRHPQQPLGAFLWIRPWPLLRRKSHRAVPWKWQSPLGAQRRFPTFGSLSSTSLYRRHQFQASRYLSVIPVPT